jgi:Flp pilus assembly protein TadG
MKTLFDTSAKFMNEKGVTLVYVALLIVVLIGIAALAVDVGYVMVSKNELQNAADSAALAGARQLGENYKDGISPVSTNVLNVAQSTASQNKATGLNLAVGNVVASIGNWDPTQARNNVPFPSGAVYPDAVKATLKRNSGTPSGAVSTFFAPIFKLIDASSQDKIPVEATACAAITGPCIAKPAIPLGIGKGWFAIHPGEAACGPMIFLGDTKDSCAGWTNLSTDAKQIKQGVSDLLTGKTVMPLVTAGSEAQFTGGTVTGLYRDLETLFNKMRVVNDPEKGDADNDPNTWTTSVVVYDRSCDQNPNKLYKILGFAMLTITKVTPTGNDKGIEAKVACHMTIEARGGCEVYGTFASIPGLVQ